ncbi:MAG: hypothetical protein IT442_08055 [Phycisphaeraceae bacterium]|nr:hypothetical protein [Phycisphaeraceae bacterium]
MNPFDDLIARATAKLSMDGELKLEIGRELRGHLEDSAAEYEAGSYTAERAAEEAVKHLGDPEELAQELWRANRGRLRVRAVAKWAAQILLVPAAVVVAMWVLVRPSYTLVQLARLHISEPSNTPVLSTMQAVDRAIPDWIGVTFRSIVGDPNAQFTAHDLAGLSQDQRWVLLGDPGAEDDLERAKSIVDRWPDNPIYYGNYVNLAMMEFVRRAREGSAAEARAWYLPILDRGETVEPDNSYYGVARTSVILTGACDVEDAATQPSGGTTQTADRPDFESYVLTIHDEGAIERAMAELHRAVARPRYTSHAVDMARLRLEMLPAPTSLLEWLNRQILCVGILLPDLGTTRRLTRIAGCYAWRLAEQDEADRALAIVHDVSLLGSMMIASGDTVIGMLVGQTVVRRAGEYERWILEHGGEPARAARAAAELEALEQVYLRTKRVDPLPDEARREMSVVGRIFTASIAGYVVDYSPTRRAEFALAENAGLGVLLATLSAGLVVVTLVGLAGLALVRGGRVAPMLFVGWRRIGRVLGWGVLAPIVGYVIYIHLPVANRQFSFNYTPERHVLELLTLGGVMLAVLWRQTRRAVAERAAEVGVALPVPRWSWLGYVRAGVLVLLGAAVCAYIAAWQFEGLRPVVAESGGTLRTAGGNLIVVMLLAMVIATTWRAGRLVVGLIRDSASAVVTIRSAAPILAAVVIVLGMVGGMMLRQVEAEAMAHTRGSQDFLMVNEVDHSAYREMRDWHVRRLEELRAREGAGQTRVPPGSAGG